MDSTHLARLKKVTLDLHWAVVEAEYARYGVAEERTENKIWEDFDRANEVRREIQAPQGQARQQNKQNRPSKRPYNRKILW